MARLLARVGATVEFSATDLSTRERLVTADDFFCLFSTVTGHLNWLVTWAALSLMAFLLTVVLSAIEHLPTRLFTAECCATCKMAWHKLCLLLTVALYRDANVARRAGPRMTEYCAFLMLAVLILLLVTVFSTRVWQDQRVVRRLLDVATVARIPGQVVLCVTEIAVGARPRVEREQPLGLSLSLRHVLLVALLG